MVSLTEASFTLENEQLRFVFNVFLKDRVVLKESGLNNGEGGLKRECGL